MSALKNEVISDTLSEVEVLYMSRAVSKWWNANKSPEDTRIFGGWYWVKDGREGGPFRTKSSALRDAYYRFVLHQKLPRAWAKEPPRSVLHPRKTAAKHTREARAAL
jgi:hypothetical protein